MNKKILLLTLLIFSMNTFSNHLKFLEDGQDSYVDSFNQTVKKYCEIIYKTKNFKGRNFTDCYLQMKFDCKHSKSKRIKKGACISLKDLRKLEDFFAMTEKNILELKKNKRTIAREPKKKIKPFKVKVPKLVFGVPNFLCLEDDNLEESGNTASTIESVRAGNRRLVEIQDDNGEDFEGSSSAKKTIDNLISYKIIKI